jgi:hypothetical protein
VENWAEIHPGAEICGGFRCEAVSICSWSDVIFDGFTGPTCVVVRHKPSWWTKFRSWQRSTVSRIRRSFGRIGGRMHGLVCFESLKVGLHQVLENCPLYAWTESCEKQGWVETLATHQKVTKACATVSPRCAVWHLTWLEDGIHQSLYAGND